MIAIKCAKCKTRIFRYVKIGQGNVIKCYHQRIREDNAVYEGNLVKCPCGNLMGKNEGQLIRLRRSSFIYTGHKH